MSPILNNYGVKSVFVVNAFQWTTRHKSHCVTLNHLEQELSTEAATLNSQLATHAVRNRAAVWVVVSGGIFKNLLNAQVNVNWRQFELSPIYTLSLLGVILLDYFVPFIFSNPYFLL
jgi:hypothetical protein